MVDIPKALQDAIQKNKLIIFVGAGLSINHGLPSWNALVSNLLKNQKEYIDKSDAYLNALNSGVLTALEVLEKIKIEKKLILESFENDLKIENKESQIHQVLGNISNRFITTNFDTLIESNSDIKNVITQDSPYNLSKIDTIDNFLIKIHGDVSRLDSCVIFIEQYKKLYQDHDDTLAIFQLKKLISKYSFLFIGFSFNDPFVNELFDYMSQLMEGYGPKHFFISSHEKTFNNMTNINIGEYKNLEDYLISLNNLKLQKITSNLDPIQKNESDILIETDGSDIAPSVSGWVGRGKELSILKTGTFKVYFITGIGGEGKSALASHYISGEKDCDIIDWRDFKEEEHKFQYKIYSMIKKVNTNIDNNKLIGLTEDQLIAYFFKELGSKKSVFVLDNVDSYIDLENFEPLGGISKLFKAAMHHEHKAKFIFTCRPFIRYAHVDFYQLQLAGLNETNTIEYFLQENTNINRTHLEQHAIKAHSLTNGHALWLTLILAQARRGEQALIDFLFKIESGIKIDKDDSSILSKNLLGNIWSSLQERDKLVLRTLAEAVVPETTEDYAEILSSELNYNKFQKALKALRNLNLIIEKRNTDYIELHPLVKEFIRTNYGSYERNKYIAMFIQYYDRYVVILKNKLSYKMGYDEFINFTNKAELSINAGNYQEAINTLEEVVASMVSAGFIEEYLRVAKLLFSTITWTKKRLDTFTQFDDLLNTTIRYFVEYGDIAFANNLITSYESIIENKGESYIRICSTKSYMYWFNKNYEKAIEISEEANYLLERADQADKFGIKHNQALAYRDTKIIENIDKALEYFLLNDQLSNLINKSLIPKEDSGVKYGNVGKCLYLKDMKDDSLICYFKAFYYIFTRDIAQRLINLGYAAFWIAEVLMELNKTEQAYYFFKYSYESWNKSSPVLINQNSESFKNLTVNSTSRSIASQEFWKIEKFCIETIENQIAVKFKLI